jgi:hypothetical protein
MSNSTTKSITPKKKRRAVSLTELFSEKFDEFDFKDSWQDSFGKPERKAVWFVGAEVGSGKTTFVSMLARYMSQFGLVDYDSIEEGKSKSLSKAFTRAGLRPGDRRVRVLDKLYMDELEKRLDKHKSASIVIIDTIQHSDLDKATYLRLKAKYEGKKTFIFISHLDGKKPEGSVAKFIYQDAGIKINIEGFMAFVKSRYVDGVPRPFTIYEKGAEAYWGIDYIEGFKNSLKRK